MSLNDICEEVSGNRKMGNEIWGDYQGHYERGSHGGKTGMGDVTRRQR